MRRVRSEAWRYLGEIAPTEAPDLAADCAGDMPPPSWRCCLKTVLVPWGRQCPICEKHEWERSDVAAGVRR